MVSIQRHKPSKVIFSFHWNVFGALKPLQSKVLNCTSPSSLHLSELMYDKFLLIMKDVDQAKLIKSKIFGIPQFICSSSNPLSVA